MVALRHMGSSQTRERTGVPCIARQILNRWTTWEALSGWFSGPVILKNNHKHHLQQGSLLYLQNRAEANDLEGLLHPQPSLCCYSHHPHALRKLGGKMILYFFVPFALKNSDWRVSWTCLVAAGLLPISIYCSAAPQPAVPSRPPSHSLFVMWHTEILFIAAYDK